MHTRHVCRVFRSPSLDPEARVWRDEQSVAACFMGRIGQPMELLNLPPFYQPHACAVFKAVVLRDPRCGANLDLRAVWALCGY